MSTRVVDVVIAVVCAALFARIAALSGDVPWAWLAALVLPLVVRSRWPLAVFGVTCAVALAATFFGVLGPAQLVVPMIAAYTVARYSAHRWLLAAPVVPFTVLWLYHGGGIWNLLALLACGVAVVLFGQNQRLVEDRAAVRERERIAREMHDIVAHNLVVMVALADGALAAPARAEELIRQNAATGREALREIRRLVGTLRDREPQPGFADLPALIEQTRSAGLEVTFTADGEPGDWGPGAGLAVYRIVQEALTNTMKHGGPRAHVHVDYHASAVDVEITGEGGTRSGRGGGQGLVGMRERAAAFGGHVEAGPSGNGWRVRAHLVMT